MSDKDIHHTEKTSQSEEKDGSLENIEYSMSKSQRIMTLSKNGFTFQNCNKTTNLVSARNKSNWKQRYLNYYSNNLSKNYYYINKEIDQEPKILEVMSSNYKNNNLCALTITFLNCRSFTYEKKTLMNSRDDDIILYC